MATVSAAARHDGFRDDLRAILEAQRATFLAEGPPSAEVRIGRIDRLIAITTGEADRLVEALRSDYGHRSTVQSMLADVIGPLPTLKNSRKNVRRWMRPTRHSTGVMRLIGTRAWVEWQPLGVVGIISPWNFPVGLAFTPLAQAFAAGNRAMLKLSEFVPATSEVMREAVEREFDPTELAVVTGGPEVGARFSQLPFDHLFFTGATAVGRHVQRAAAENLVPVTLELGGKSPVVIDEEADLGFVADRVISAKLMNVGQLCLAPDYLLVPKGKEERLVEALKTAVEKMAPNLLENDDYSSIVAERHRQRLFGYLDDARAKGARVIEVNPAGEDFSNQPAHKIPPTILLGVTDDMTIMQEEIFGPLLPIVPYEGLDAAIAFVNARPRPLAAYYFGPDGEARRQFLDRTHSGGVTLNDTVLHVAIEDLPFGGVGASGMGYYHGRAGFETFSHARAVVDSSRLWTPNKLLAPPYGKTTRRLLRWLVRREAKSVSRRLEGRRSASSRPAGPANDV